jgi:hypothetical protein
VGIVRTGIESVGHKFLNGFIGARVQTFREELDDAVTDLNLYLRPFIPNFVELLSGHSPPLHRCRMCALFVFLPSRLKCMGWSERASGMTMLRSIASGARSWLPL